MVGKLPLDSPLWGGLSACYSAENAVVRLREIVVTRQLGEAWSGLREEFLHQGSPYGVSSAAIPHLVDVAPYLPAASRRDLWMDFLADTEVTPGDSCYYALAWPSTVSWPTN